MCDLRGIKELSNILDLFIESAEMMKILVNRSNIYFQVHYLRIIENLFLRDITVFFKVYLFNCEYL